MKVGNLIWQSRLPGGICIYLGEEVVQEPTKYPSDRYEQTYYRVLHPVEGLVFEPSYYYEEINDELRKRIYNAD